MGYIKEEEIKQIKEQADIVDIVSSYLSLQQKGKNFVSVCPFHDDHSPSMSISKEKQIFRCFVCGASGNVISFVKDYENNKMNLEGIVAKEKKSIYEKNTRTENWLKIKNIKSE